MHPEPVGQLQITEADLVESAPRVRALMVARLEALWSPVNARLQRDAGGDEPIDPRLLEIGLRVIKEEAAIYRLSRLPQLAEEEEEPEGAGVDRAAVIEARLAELEAAREKQASKQQ